MQDVDVEQVDQFVLVVTETIIPYRLPGWELETVLFGLGFQLVVRNGIVL